MADDGHQRSADDNTASRGGRSMTANDADVMHLRDGKVTEFWTSSTDPYA